MKTIGICTVDNAALLQALDAPCPNCGTVGRLAPRIKSRLGLGSVAEERAVIARKGAALRSYGLTWKDVGTRLGVSAQHARKCFLEAGRKEDA